MKKTTSGFTIVELLIVIVVIAILATISIVAYNGIQERAKNVKTVSVVTQWVKALQMYKADNGSYPTAGGCLGSGYGMGFSGNDASGGHCRSDNASAHTTMNPSFITLMNTYIGGNPTPSFVTAGSASFPWFRGAYYYPVPNAERVDFVMAGSSTPCPAVAGLNIISNPSYPATNSRLCAGALPQ